MVIGAMPRTAYALYRGDEVEFRDFKIGSTYFINRLIIDPEPDALERFRIATNAFIGAAGSLTRADLHLWQDLKIHQPLGGPLSLKLRYLHDRDFDAKYQRFSMGLEYRVTPEWAVELIGEPLPDKELADIGGAISYAGERAEWRAQWLFVDFTFDDKNRDDARMDRRAGNLQLDARYQTTRTLTLGIRADLDFPLRLINPEESFRFDMEKYRAGAETWWRPSEAELVYGVLEGEYARKRRDGLQSQDRQAFTTARDFLLARIEYRRRVALDARWRLGAQYVQLEEDNRFLFSPDDTLLLDRHDRMLYVGRSWPLRDRVRFDSMLIGNVIDSKERRADPARDHIVDRFQLEVAGSLVFHGPGYQIELGPSLHMDAARFGGGFVKAYAEF